MNLDVVIDAPGHSVDMKSGLETLQGVSDATRHIAETLLIEKVPQRLTHKSSVRTSLKKSFKGSYGHIYSLEIYDDLLRKKFRKIGAEVFSELIKYFLNEAMYLDGDVLSAKASKIVESLDDEADELIYQLRRSAMENIHEVATKFGYEVKVRFRQSASFQKVLVAFNDETAKALHAKHSDQLFDLFVSITRLNINTGNGRFLIQGQEDTVAFGFGVEYKDVRLSSKKVFSENLDYNNGLDSSEWKYLKVSVSPIELNDGRVIKYLVKKVSRGE